MLACAGKQTLGDSKSCTMLPNRVVELGISDSEADELAMCVHQFFPEGITPVPGSIFAFSVSHALCS